MPEIAGYEISLCIGAGAMGEVYRAVEQATGREVALKVISPALLQHKEILSRFAREARVQSLIDHPSVVRIFHAELEGPTPFLAMEFIQGQDLESMIRAEGRLPLDQVAGWMTDLGEALDSLHAQGAIHRDLKPANLMVRDDGGAVVMDLGLAALEQATRITKTGKLIGTPLYLPPEILDGSASGPRSDQWQMGAVLFECLTGIRLVPGRSLQEIGAALATGRYNAFPEELYDQIPEHVRETVYRAVFRDPAHRFPDITEMARSLQAEEHEDRTRTREIAAQVIAAATRSTLPAPAAAAQKLSPSTRPPERAPGRGGPLGIALGLVILGAALFFATGTADPPRDIEWSSIGDVVRVRFAGGGTEVRAEVEGGEPSERIDLPDGRKEIRIRGPRPGSQPTVRLRWEGGESLPSTVRVDTPAISSSPSFGPPGKLVFPVRREVSWTEPGASEARVLPPGEVEVSVVGRDRLDLAWREEGIDFRLSESTGSLVDRALEALRDEMGDIELRAAGLRTREVSPAALHRARVALLRVSSWIPTILDTPTPTESTRWFWSTLQEYAWGLASEEGRGAAADERLGLGPGQAGNRTFDVASVPAGHRLTPALSSLFKDGREEPGAPHKVAPRFVGEMDVFTRDRYRRYPVAVRFRWPEGLPATGNLWLGIDPERLASSTHFRIRAEDPAASDIQIRLWGPTVLGAMKRVLHKDPLGIFLPAALAPAPGTSCLVEVLPLVENVANSSRLEGLWMIAIPDDPGGRPPPSG